MQAHKIRQWRIDGRRNVEEGGGEGAGEVGEVGEVGKEEGSCRGRIRKKWRQRRRKWRRRRRSRREGNKVEMEANKDEGEMEGKEVAGDEGG